MTFFGIWIKHWQQGSNTYLAFSKSGLTPDSGPARGTQERNKFRQITCVLRKPDKAAQGMDLTGPATLSVNSDLARFTPSSPNFRGALSNAMEIQVQRALTVNRSQCTNPVTNTFEEHREVRAKCNGTLRLQFRRRQEIDAYRAHRLCGRRKIQTFRWGNRGRNQRAIGEYGLHLRAIVSLLHGNEMSTAAMRTQALTAYLGERQDERRQSTLAHIEQIHVEVKRGAGSNSGPIQMTSAEDKRPRQIGKTARSGAVRSGLEEARVVAGITELACAGIAAFRNTSDVAEYRTERAAEYVARLPGGETHQILSYEVKAQRAKGEGVSGVWDYARAHSQREGRH